MTSTIQNPPYSKAQSWKIFDAIYRRYDLLNTILSLGLDKMWRQKLLEFVPQRQNIQVLDLATGTADVIITLVANKANIKTALGIDLSKNMLRVGQKKVDAAKLSDRITLQTADAAKLPFLDNQFDMTTMAFGIRNVENPIIVLKEIYRVLNTDGRAVILEFSLPENFFIKCLYLVYLKFFVPLVGTLISGNFKAYFYLNHTIEKFPYGQVFIRMMRQCGFKRVSVTTLLFGVATIYVGEKT